jgi:two-component system, cell cycle response regulator DivK
MKLLLVEDNELNRDMLSRRLERRGYTVVCAGDGDAALTAAASDRPDLILMDMDLPVVSGWDATRSTRDRADGARASRRPRESITGRLRRLSK